MFGDASGRGKSTGRDSITPAGEAAVAQFDPIADNPVVRCEGGSPVRNWGTPGLATAIRQENDQIFIYHESMDITRRVHMNLTEHPADVERSDMGHSIGRFEDGVLIIDTAGFAAGVLDGSMLHTEQMTMQEKLWVAQDTGRLQVSWIVNEPIYYSKPLTGSQELQSTTQEIIRYDCVPGSPGSY